jgi:1-acyl-sn-glycerol-3-phosphate acyltransferase
VFTSVGVTGIAATLRLAGVRCRVHGAERVPEGRGAVLCINHTSALDVAAFLALRPHCRHLLVLYKAELRALGLIAHAFDTAGFIAIDRGAPDDARHAIDRGTEALVRGDSILVSPEGTRSRNGRLGPLKKGVFVMAIRAGAPIVPALPRGSLIIRARELRISIGDPIETRARTYEERDALSAETARALEDLIRQAATE